MEDSDQSTTLTIEHRFEPNAGPQDLFCRSKAIYPAYIGGFGSGKTWAGSTKLVLAHLQYPGSDSLAVAPTYQNVKQILFPAILERLTECGVEAVPNMNEMIIATPQIGSKILLHSGIKAERITGFEVGRAWIDEPARIPDFPEPKRNVWHNVTARVRDKNVPHDKWQVFITGTHEGKGSWVYKRWEDKGNEKYRVYRGSTFDNPHMLEYAKNLEEDYDTALAQQYLYGYAVDSEMAAIPWDVITSCQSADATSEMDWHALSQVRMKKCCGVDVGRSKSLTVIWINGMPTSNTAQTLAVIELRNTPFNEQRDMINRVMAIPGMGRCHIDATYNPQLAEEAQQRHGGRIEPVIFNIESKQDLALGLIRAANEKRIAIPVDEDIAADWYSVKRVVTKQGRVTYSAPYTSDGHADRFWAAALACVPIAKPQGPVNILPKRTDRVSRKVDMRI